jgi:hypothetical protein
VPSCPAGERDSGRHAESVSHKPGAFGQGRTTGSLRMQKLVWRKFVRLSAGGSEIRTLGPPTAVSSVVAPSTRSSLRDKGAGAGAGVQQTTDLLINAPHIKCWSSCPVTSGPRSRSIHARSRAATSRTRWTRRRSRRRVRASRRPAGDVSDLSDEEVRKIDLASAMF